jgi:hypothetical protein
VAVGPWPEETTKAVSRVPHSGTRLELSAEPRSVQDARRWVIQVCEEIGRPDLGETAGLAISELVTNALLHAEGPFTLRRGGTAEHPRFEVHDGSVTPPTPNPRMTDEDELLSTIGRGLGLVAMCSKAWGARIHEQGKVVWFAPVAEPRGDIDLHEAKIEYDVAPVPDTEPLVDPVSVYLLRLPIPLLREFRHRYREIRRELRLLTLCSESAYPVARSIADLFESFTRTIRVGSGREELEQAVASDAEQVDLVFTIERDAVSVVAQMMDILEITDSFCEAERLLAPAATPEQTAFRRWFLGEFVAQGCGGPPTLWTAAQPAARRVQA